MEDLDHVVETADDVVAKQAHFEGAIAGDGALKNLKEVFRHGFVVEG